MKVRPRPVAESVEPLGTEPARVNTAGAVQLRAPCKFAPLRNVTGAPALITCAVAVGAAEANVSGDAPDTDNVSDQLRVPNATAPRLVSNVNTPLDGPADINRAHDGTKQTSKDNE